MTCLGEVRSPLEASVQELCNARQLQGETRTGAAQGGIQAMNSFLSLVTNPFADNRGFAPERPLPPPALIYKAPVYKAPIQAVADPRRWTIWAAAYGGQTNMTGSCVYRKSKFERIDDEVRPVWRANL
jgi:hypothetical protein